MLPWVTWTKMPYHMDARTSSASVMHQTDVSRDGAKISWNGVLVRLCLHPAPQPGARLGKRLGPRGATWHRVRCNSGWCWYPVGEHRVAVPFDFFAERRCLSRAPLQNVHARESRYVTHERSSMDGTKAWDQEFKRSGGEKSTHASKEGTRTIKWRIRGRPVSSHGSSAALSKLSATITVCLSYGMVEATFLQQRSANVSCQLTSLGSLAWHPAYNKALPRLSLHQTLHTLFVGLLKQREQRSWCVGEGIVRCIIVHLHTQVCLLNGGPSQEPAPPHRCNDMMNK